MATKKSDSQNSISIVLVIVLALIMSIITAFVTIAVQRGSIPVPSISMPVIGSIDKKVNTLAEKGKPDQALKEIKKLSKKEQEQPHNLLLQGRMWYFQAWKMYHEKGWSGYAKDMDDWFVGEEVENALYYLKRATESVETAAEAHFYLGVIYMDKGWLQDSKVEFEVALEANPNHKEALLNYGVLHTRLQEYHKARGILQEALEKYPDYPPLYKNLFWIYTFHTRDIERAIYYGDTFLQKAQQGNPDIGKVKREMFDMLARFPEYDSPDLFIHKEKVREFIPRIKRKVTEDE